MCMAFKCWNFLMIWFELNSAGLGFAQTVASSKITHNVSPESPEADEVILASGPNKRTRIIQILPGSVHKWTFCLCSEIQTLLLA